MLAHRISLVAMQAGCWITAVTTLGAEESRVLVAASPRSSHQALEELLGRPRRAQAATTQAQAPQPSFEAIPGLVADARTSDPGRGRSPPR
ncbi:hypothetical protein LV779_26495 [Streptomyces thinghirensis]|nr:hypothetical protein [Streptomyces thinghirensis]